MLVMASNTGIWVLKELYVRLKFSLAKYIWVVEIHCCAASNPPLAHALMTQAPVEILVNFGEFQCSCSSQFWPKIVRILCVVKPKINFGCPQCIVEPTMHCCLTMRDNASQFYPTFGDVALQLLVNTGLLFLYSNCHPTSRRMLCWTRHLVAFQVW